MIHYGETIEVKNYLQRVKNIISNNKFIYKDNKIDVRFCAGVSFRDKYNSYEDCMKKADELLYIAKADGRDRIVLVITSYSIHYTKLYDTIHFAGGINIYLFWHI